MDKFAARAFALPYFLLFALFVVGLALVGELVRLLLRGRDVAPVAELAAQRRAAYDAGVSVGRELQRAMHACEAPFPPAPLEFGDAFPRYGVELPPLDRMQWGSRPADRHRPPGDEHR
jgi:hypothetical protein